MAVYTIEILAFSSNTKALKLIKSLTGLSTQEIKRRLKSPPLVVRDSIALTEAVTIERQLRKLGLNTRIGKMEVQVEDSTEEQFPLPAQPETEEVIEIPEEEVRVLFPMNAQKGRIKVKRIKFSQQSQQKRALLLVLLPLATLLAMLVGWYAISRSRAQQTQLELSEALEQWTQVLRQQEVLLDKGDTPQQILAKLNDIENKITRLEALLASTVIRKEFSRKFKNMREQNAVSLRDLSFRRRLEEAGYPLHPICLVERGRVRGYSELPDGTLLRIRLLGSARIEAIPFTANISEGVFNFDIPPAVEKSIYDAHATIAPLSQQPTAVREWAQLTLSLPGFATEKGEAASRPLNSAAPSEQNYVPNQSKSNSEPQLLLPLSGASSNADSGAVIELPRLIMEWQETLQAAASRGSSAPAKLLEELFQRLLSLESRIDQLIQLLEADEARDYWTLRREEAYGEFISARADLQEWHEEFHSRSNPLYLETSLHRSLQTQGFSQIQVLVVDSPKQAEAFEIEIEMPVTPGKEWPGRLISTILIEVGNTQLNIAAVRLQQGDNRYSWTMEQISQAAAALDQATGEKRCAAILGIGSASSESSP